MKQEGTPTQRMRESTRSAIRVLGAKARRLRKERGLTRQELGDISGLSPNYIGGVELGQRDPSVSTVEALARGLGIPVAELFGPTQPLSEKAIEMARLFSEAPEKIQRALLDVLRIATRKPEGTK
jgi:transcriptional regulator with XRE-family HTH domain